MNRIETIIVCTDDEQPDMTLSGIPKVPSMPTTVVHGTRPCSTPRIVNAAMDEIRALRGDPWLWMIVHPDVELAEDYLGNLTREVIKLSEIDPDYGVIGVMGVRLQDGDKWCVGHLWDRVYEAGAPLSGPCIVDTLDEVLIVMRGDWPLKLDESLGTYHLWASELCLRERKYGRKNYVLPGMYIKHHSTAPHTTPDDAYFYYNLGVLSERYRNTGETLLTPSGAVYDKLGLAGVQLC